jgi:hypothetical protein
VLLDVKVDRKVNIPIGIVALATFFVEAVVRAARRVPVLERDKPQKNAENSLNENESYK